MSQEINIPINIPIEGADEAANKIIKLIEIIKQFQESISKIPIEEANKRLDILRNQFGTLQTSIIQTSGAVNKDAEALSTWLEEAEGMITTCNRLVTSQNMLGKSALEVKGYMKGLEQMVVSVSAQMAKCDLATEKGVIRYNELKSKLQETNAQLNVFKTSVEETTEVIEGQNGKYKEMLAVVKQLTKDRDELLLTESKESEQVVQLTSLINKYTLELQINQRELNGVNTANSILQKHSEALTRILNTNVKSIVSLTLAKRELSNQVKSQLPYTEKEIEGFNRLSQAAQKREIAEINSVLRTEQRKEEIRQKSFDKAWLEGEKYQAQQAKLNAIEAGSIDALKIKVKELEAQWSKLGPAGRVANKALRQELIQTREELVLLEEQARKTGGAIGIAQRALRFLNTSFFRGIGTLVVWGVMFSALFKLWDLFTQGTDATKKAREELEKYQDALNDVEKTAQGNIAKTISESKELLMIAQDINLTDKVRIDAIRQLRKEHAGLLEQYKDEQLLKGQTAELEKKISDLSVIEAKIDISRGKQKVFAQRQVDAQQELDDIYDVKNRSKNYIPRRIEEVEYELSKNLGSKEFDPNRDKLLKELNDLKSGSFDITKLTAETPDQKMADKRLALQTWYQNLVGDNKQVNILNLSKRVETLKGVVKESREGQGYYGTETLKNLEAKDKILGKDTDKLNENQITAEIQQLEDDIRNSIDLRKYGLSLETVTKQDIYRLRKDGKVGEESAEIQKKLKDITRLKYARRALRGREEPQGGHRGRNPFTDALATEEQRTADNQSLLREGYDSNNPFNTFEDDYSFYEKQKVEADRHYKEMTDLSNKYRKTQWQNEEQYTKNILKAEKEKTQVYNKANESQNQLFLQQRKNYEDAINATDKYIESIAKLNLELDRLNDKYQTQIKRNDRKLKNAGRVNPLFAATGVEDANFAFKNSQDDIRFRIEEKQQEVSDNSKERDRLIEKASLTRQWLDANGGGSKQDDANAIKSDKTGQFKVQLEEYRSYQTAILGIDKKTQTDLTSIQDLESQFRINAAQREADAKKAIIKKSFDTVVDFANQAYANQRQKLQDEIRDTQARYSFEQKLAGNNAAAKRKIALTEHALVLALKKKEAQAEKQQAIFVGLVNTYKGVSEALGSAPPPYSFILAGLVLAAGLKNVADITSKQPPSYRKGRKGGPAEVARINEEDKFELVEKDGKFRIPNQGKEGLVQLHEGESVIPHDKSSNFLKQLLIGNQVVSQREFQDRRERVTAIHSGLSKHDYFEAMSKALKENSKEGNTFTLPAKDVQDRHTRQQIRNGL